MANNYDKKDVISMLDILIKTNRLMKIITANGEQIDIDTLSTCQQTAINIGTYIEQRGGKEIVGRLEEYCECLYELSCLSLEYKDVCKKEDDIEAKLSEIKKMIECYLSKDKKRVIFLPYKASMWDSLEGEWKKECECKDTEVYVVPIPYYDKKADGTMGEKHYELDEYPDYVKVTKYTEFDFSSKITKIYIHNPYDDSNMVTSVPNFFYSSNLKKITEQLIYIPYFCVPEIKLESKKDMEKMQHFCVLPGVINADKVIVQSENIKKVYVSILTSAFGEKAEWKEYFEKKIIAGTSYKIQKIKEMKMEDVYIPENWKRLIYRKNGTRKKIVFYNNSLEAMLKRDGQMLDKIESVLFFFKTHQEDVILLWRPHPLLESTLKSMRPQLLQRYQQIKEQFMKEKWGIYDDTADIDRAIMISDAYYGDPSSVVEMYKQTGKTIMIQDVGII